MRNRICTTVLVLLVVSGCVRAVAQPGGGASAAQLDEGDIRFAIALVQGLVAYAEPRVTRTDGSWAFPILRPMRVMESVCVDRDLNRVPPSRLKAAGVIEEHCPNPAKQALWYRLERDQGRYGWAMADHVAIWNSRHALRPTTEGVQDTIPGFCDQKQAENAARGRSEPCLVFNRRVLSDMGDRAPFPVLDVREFGDGIEYDRHRYFKVLVPTLYSKIGVHKGSSKSAMVAEFMILVDATNSMDAEIEGTKAALKDFVQKIQDEYNVDARFAVIGYRDTDGSSQACPPMEATTDASGRLTFVSARDAERFLGNLKACGGGDPREAIWDALYLLRDLPVAPGASRVLILIGDTPSVAVTRGLDLGPTKVPKGLGSQQVLSSISDTFGESTWFMALFVKSGMMKKTVDDILKGARFVTSSTARVERVTPEAVRDRVAGFIRGLARQSSDDVTDLSECNSKYQVDDGGGFGFFCGNQSSLSPRLKDLISQSNRDPTRESIVVIREIWVSESSPLVNVALLTVGEAKTMAQRMGQLAQKIGEDGSQCRRYGSSIWTETVRSLVPVDESAGSATPGGIAVVGKRLHDYWRLAVGKGGSLINYTPEQIASLDSDRCLVVRDRIYRSSQSIERTMQVQKRNQYIWLNFDCIP